MPQVDRFLVIFDKDTEVWHVVDVLYKVVIAKDFATPRLAGDFVRERIRDYNSPIVQRHHR